jgi:hypothetical protein
MYNSEFYIYWSSIRWMDVSTSGSVLCTLQIKNFEQPWVEENLVLAEPLNLWSNLLHTKESTLPALHTVFPYTDVTENQGAVYFAI